MIKTKRLILRPLQVNDANDLYLYFNDKDINKYLYVTRYNSLDEIKNLIKQSNNKNYHCFGIEYDNKMIGDISISINQNYGEIAWVINKNYQNQGFAFEASKEYIKYIFANYDIKIIKAHCDVNNKASNYLMKKLGFKYLLKSVRIYNDERKTSFEYEYELKNEN